MISSSVVKEESKSENHEHEENSPISILLKRCKKYDGVTLPVNIGKFFDRIRNMQIRSDDIWLCGVPKSGITWIQEVVWCLANLKQYGKAEKPTIAERFPLFEFTTLLPEQQKALKVVAECPEYYRDSLSYVEKLPSPRFIKTHLPFAFLPEKLQKSEETKIVYVARNPRDNCISYYHFAKLLVGPIPDFDLFCKQYIKGEFQFLPYWDHVLRFWRMRHNSNVLFVTYEEIMKDLKNGIVKIANFLGETLREEQLQILVKHLSFDNIMKNADSTVNREESETVNTRNHPRFGQRGHLMTESIEQEFQKWTEENLRDTDYPHSL